MKKLFALFAIFCSSLFGQTYTITWDHINYSDTLNSEIIFDGTVKNVSSSEITLYFTKHNVQMPANWTASFCFDACFPYMLDSICTTPDFSSSPLAPNDIRHLSLHIYPVDAQGTAKVKVNAGRIGSVNDTMSFVLTANSILDVAEHKLNAHSFKLYQNYPNPFNPSTNISFEVKDNGVVKLEVFNMIGQRVSTITNKYHSAGIYSYKYDASQLNSGLYFYKLTSANNVQTKKMVVLK